LSLDACTTGANNTSVGHDALGATTTGNSNTAVGEDCLQANTTASNNTAVGRRAMFSNTTGTDNVAMGHNALDANTTANNNTAIGHDALTENTTGAQNTAIGSLALDANTLESKGYSEPALVDKVGEGFGAENRNFTLESFEIAAKDRKLKYDNLFYPEDIATNKQDRVVFKMFYQSGRNLNFSLERGDNVFTFGERKITNILGSVTLPIQNEIADQNTVSYQEGTLDPVRGVLASVALDPVQAASQALELLNKDVSELQQAINSPASQNVINVLRTFLAQSAVGAQGLIPRTTGAILNPNIELLLKAPDLRSFSFNFRMSARSRTEAQQIRKIIRFFKQGMSVKRSTSSLFVLTPNLFNIQYLAAGEGNLLRDHPSIGKIKPCALTAINTQYTPDGTYMTFDDEARTMTSYNIQMQFKELEPLTETDYAETAAREDAIGY